jgi:hypothetical protein
VLLEWNIGPPGKSAPIRHPCLYPKLEGAKV